MIQDNFSIQKEYYSARAPEFEQIYTRDDPVRKREIETISSLIERELKDKRVLEIACGTGFWTQFATRSADYVVATDFSESMLEIARSKMALVDRVSFRNCDALILDQIDGKFNAGMANFFLSHVPKSRLKEFLTGFHNRLEKEATVIMVDNVFVPSLGGDLIRKSGSEDSFKLRELANCSRYEIVKNYFTEEQLLDILEPFARDISIMFGECFWWLVYRTGKQ